MEKALNQLPRAAKVAFVCPSTVTECVLTLPAIEMVRRHRPDLRLAAVSGPRCRCVYEGNPHLDAVITHHLPPLLMWGPSMCINFDGGWRSLILTELSWAQVTVAFPGSKAEWAYSELLPPLDQVWGETREFHLAEKYAAAAIHVGVPKGKPPAASMGAPEHRPQTPFAVVHPFPLEGQPAWSERGFLEVAAYLRSNGFDVVFPGEKGSSLAPFASYRTLPDASLADIKILIANSAFFAGHLTGFSHMAAAFDVPQVVLCEPEAMAGRMPWRARAEASFGEPGEVIAAIGRMLEVRG